MRENNNYPMKLSVYTSVIPLNDKFYLLFSAKTDKFIVCNKNLLSVADDGTVTTGTEKLYDQLVEIDALKNDTVDEIAQISELIDKVDNDDRVFHIHVNPTLNCNFRCWYCYEEHQPESKMSEVTMESIIALARNEINENKNLELINLSFFGGEPLMYFDSIAGQLIKTIKSLCDKNEIRFNSHFTTNGYLLTDNILETIKDVNIGFQITIDGGQPYHDKVRCTQTGNGSYRVILNNILKLASASHYVILRINFTTENIDSVKDIIDDLNTFDSEIRKYIQVDFQRVWQDRPTITETEIISKITDFVVKLRAVGYNCTYASNIGPNHVKRSCYGDKKNHLLINYDGNVFLCTARDFKPQNSAGKLVQNGVVIWNEEKGNVTPRVNSGERYATHVASLRSAVEVVDSGL